MLRIEIGACARNEADIKRKKLKLKFKLKKGKPTVCASPSASYEKDRH